MHPFGSTFASSKRSRSAKTASERARASKSSRINALHHSGKPSSTSPTVTASRRWDRSSTSRSIKTSSARAAPGTPTESSASAKAAKTPRASSRSIPISPLRSKARSGKHSTPFDRLRMTRGLRATAKRPQRLRAEDLCESVVRGRHDAEEALTEERSHGWRSDEAAQQERSWKRSDERLRGVMSPPNYALAQVFFGA